MSVSFTQRTLFDQPLASSLARESRTCCEYFAGIGLARLGLERAGWVVRLAGDIDPAKKRMYEDHFGPSPHYVCGDIHHLATRPDDVPRAILAHASFPCTDLSLAGARRGIHAGQSSAFWGFIELLKAQGEDRPRLVLLENVLGFLTSHGGDDFHAALAALCDLGYSVDPFAVDAAHFVPQSRPRLFVMGKRDVEALPLVDPDALEESGVRPAKLIAAVQKMRDIDFTLARLPALPAYGQQKLDSILDDPPADSAQWWSDQRAAYLLSQMSDRHRGAADAMMAGRKWSFGTVFRRVRHGKSMAELRGDGLAGCLRTPKGGSARQILFQAGYGEYRVRLLNAGECARLMGAPEFRVEAPLTAALFGFGDAVCASVIEWIAINYLNPLSDALVERV